MKKIIKEFNCEICNYSTYLFSNFNKHIQTNKHKMREKEMEESQNVVLYCCENCDNNFYSRTTLWRHKKKCNFKPHHQENIITPELIMDIIRDNKNLQQIILEQNSTINNLVKNGIHTNSHNNAHNKTFNLQFFLNETCKNAMNITEFVDSIKLQLSDLERVGEIGYVEGISDIITTNLKALDVTLRPVHCTDKKRETIYIKDEDKWEKDENNIKLKKVIKNVAYKNERLLPKFKELHPGCNYSESKYSEKYSKLVIEAMGGLNNDKDKENKIIKNIAKNVVVEK